MQTEDLTGQILGEYKLVKKLGAGGMASVYLGTQASLRRDVAVKVLPLELATENGYTERFNQEAKTAAGLEHPYIVHIYDHGIHEGRSYLVMRLFNGGTLEEHLRSRSGCIDLPKAAKIVDQLASALDYAHGKGVIHRDIKPSNLMFDDQGNCYVVDFGIAKPTGSTLSMTHDSQPIVRGTWPYMPPEQWQAQPLTAATDQYALAVTMYRAITGHLPIVSKTGKPEDWQRAHLQDSPTSVRTYLKDIPQSLEEALSRALSKDPRERFPNMADFADAFLEANNRKTRPVKISDTKPQEISPSVDKHATSHTNPTQIPPEGVKTNATIIKSNSQTKYPRLHKVIEAAKPRLGTVIRQLMQGLMRLFQRWAPRLQSALSKLIASLKDLIRKLPTHFQAHPQLLHRVLLVGLGVVLALITLVVIMRPAEIDPVCQAADQARAIDIDPNSKVSASYEYDTINQLVRFCLVYPYPEQVAKVVISLIDKRGFFLANREIGSPIGFIEFKSAEIEVTAGERYTVRIDVFDGIVSLPYRSEQEFTYDPPPNALRSTR